MKETFYFSHDYNSFFDPKIRYIVSEYGVWAYACFWIVVEMMASEKEFKIQKKLLPSILYPLLQGKKINYKTEGGLGYFEDERGEHIVNEDLGCYSICLAKVESLLKLMIEIGLFFDDDKYIWSESLISRMKRRQEISEVRKMAGRKGGLAKRGFVKKEKNTNCLAKNLQANSNCLAVKESKVKEIKVNTYKEIYKEKADKKKYLDFVFLTDEEFKKLQTELGEKLKLYIEKLNNYIGSKGTKYKSHYFTILNWYRKDTPKRTIINQNDNDLEYKFD